jgi:hypothetical protein
LPPLLLIKAIPSLARLGTTVAAELGVNISEAEAVDGYDLRSRLAHGVSFLSTGAGQGPTAYQLQLYDRLEDTLRSAVLRGILEKLSLAKMISVTMLQQPSLAIASSPMKFLARDSKLFSRKARHVQRLNIFWLEVLDEESYYQRSQE